MKSRAARIKSSIHEVQEIYEAINMLAYSQDKALLDTLGLKSTSSSSSEGSDEETDYSECNSPRDSCETMPNHSLLARALSESNFNWFEFHEKIEGIMEQTDSNNVSKTLEEFFLQIPHMGLSQNQMEHTVQSHRAFQAAASESYEQERIARSINGEIVSESESDDPDQYVGITSITSAAGRELIRKKRVSIKTRHRRMRAKIVAEKRLLARKLSKRTSKVLRDCPNIGKTIEYFVEDHQVGADAWRRTGVLTFDGNSKLKDKVTYKKIQKHLETVYGRKFAFGTVVELCVPRNKRRCSSKRYKSLAKVMSRRARKGFNLRFNPDSHWSAAFYKALNKIQYVDGRNIVNINRDDATGFRLELPASSTLLQLYKGKIL